MILNLNRWTVGVALVIPLVAWGCEQEQKAPPDEEDATLEADANPGDGTVSQDSVREDLPEIELPNPGVMVINEVAPSGDPDDWIEFFNPGETAVELDGWNITDSDPAQLSSFAPGQRLEPGAYLVLIKDDIGSFGFGLGGDDSVSLFDAQGKLADYVSWNDGECGKGLSCGRIPNGTGELKTLATPTPGSANVDNPVSVCGDGTAALDEVCDGDDLKETTCEKLGWTGTDLACSEDCQSFDTAGCVELSGAVVINEVSSTGDDPIELYNTTDEAISLSGWRLTDQNDAPDAGPYYFPPDETLEPGAFMVLMKGSDHGFGLGKTDAVKLRDPGGLLVDHVAWSGGDAEISFCRIPDGTGDPAPCPATTLGQPNQ